jgi:uncharacterized protein YjbI with pentapeptide repeats
MNPSTCTFKKEIKGVGKELTTLCCDRKPYENGMCVLHLDKHVAAEDSEDEQRQITNDFLEALKKEIELARSASTDHDLNWSGVHFPAIKFNEWTFPRRVLLTAARFEHDASFNGCCFNGGLNADKSIFLGPKRNLIFDHCHFDGEVNFRSVAFGKNPVLRDCVFEKKVGFDSCKLDTPDFHDNKFNDGVMFAKSTLTGNCDFKTCIFRGVTYFQSIIVVPNALFDFRGSTFSGSMDFGAFVEQRDDMGLQAIISCAELDFSDVIVAEKTALSFQYIASGKTNFKRLQFSDGAILKFKHMDFGEGDFSDIPPQEKVIVTFQNTRLDNTIFLNTNIEKFNFNNITWHDIDGRKGLASEINLRNNISKNIYNSKTDKGIKLTANDQTRLLEEVDLNSENYRQLVKNSDARRNYTLAENFHIGEMEMQRQKGSINGALYLGVRRKLTSWNDFSIYKFISRYGTSYLHSIGVLLSIVLFIAFLFLLSGLSQQNCPEPSCRQGGARNMEIYLLPAPDRQFIGFEKMGAYYGSAIIFTLGVATLQKDTLYKTTTASGELLRVLTILLVTGQAALTLFAVRRKFRRGSGSGE